MKKVNILLVIILLMSVLIIGCERRDRAVIERNELVVASAWLPITFDPSMGNESGSLNVNRRLFNTLVWHEFIDGELIISPLLAESWEFLAPDSVRFNLRRGVRFHNGDLMRASDVKFSLERAAVSPAVGFLLNMIDEVVIVNDYEVIVNLHFPFAPILSNLSHTGAAIISERAFREYGAEFGLSRPVGTGAFKFHEFVPGSHVTFTRFEDFWGEKPSFQYFTTRFIPDASMRLIEIETGGADIAIGISPFDVVIAEANPNVNMLRMPSAAVSFVGFNHTREPFNNLYVRRAIAHAVDRETILNNIFRGIGSFAYGPVSEVVWGSFNSHLAPYEFNLTLARQYLARAGLEGGFDTTIAVNAAAQTFVDTAEFLQAELRALNINLTVEVFEWGTLLDMFARGDVNMFLIDWTTVTGDADYAMYPVLHSSNFGAGGNRAHFSNPIVDELLRRGRVETDPAVRLQIYEEVQHIIRDELPWVFLFQGELLNAASTSLRGFSMNPLGDKQHTYERAYWAN